MAGGKAPTFAGEGLQKAAAAKQTPLPGASRAEGGLLRALQAPLCGFRLASRGLDPSKWGSLALAKAWVAFRHCADPAGPPCFLGWRQDIGAMDDDQNLTRLGRHLAALPLPPQVGKMLLFAVIFRVLDPVLTGGCQDGGGQPAAFLPHYAYCLNVP